MPTANQWGLNLIQAPAAWALGYTGAGVTAAIADSGIDLAHPAFAGQVDPRSRNFQLPSAGAPYFANQVGDLDAGGHGTHGAGIMAALGGSKAPGVAFESKLVVLRILNGSPVPGIADASAAAINYFAGLSNVFIYNASYGPNFASFQNLPTWPASSINTLEPPAIFNALAAGKIIVGATGNDRNTNPVAGLNPSGIPLYPFIQPAHANLGVYFDNGANFNFSSLLTQPGTIVAVTSVGQDKRIADYAQFCGVTASWCVAAPGGNPPNVDQGVWSTLPGGNYGYQSGTSMAAPMVSGSLAVLQQAYPGYNAQDIARVLYATAENVGGQLADNPVYGFGMIRLDRATAGPNTIAAGTALNVPAQQMAYLSQPLVTGGGFSKTGDGYLIIAGRTIANGNVSVTGGALGVDGTLTLGNNQLFVAQNAGLAGFGVINGNVSIAGVLNAGQLPNYADVAASNGGTLPAGTPLTGTSPGTLTIQGVVQLGASALHRVNIDGTLLVPGGPGTYDKITVSGNGAGFVAGGTLAPVLRGIPGGFNNFTPRVGTLMPFVIAQNGAQVAGQYSNLVEPTAGLASNTRLDLRYAPNAIALAVTPVNFGTFAASEPANANQQHMASLLDQVRPAPGGRSTSRSTAQLNAEEDDLFNLLYSEDPGGDLAALASLAGQGQAAMPGAVMSTFSGFANTIIDHQSMLLTEGAGVQAAFMPSISMAYARGASTEARLAAVPFPDSRQSLAQAYGQWLTWGQAYGRWSRVGDAGGLPGYKSNGGGFVVGADRRASGDLTVGGAFGYARTATASFDTKGTTDTYAAGVYTTWTPGRFVFDGRIAAGPTTNGTARTIAFPGESAMAAASFNGWGGLIAGEAGYRFDVAGAIVKPYAGLSGQVLRQGGFTETSEFGLTFPAEMFHKVTTTAGVWTAKTVRVGDTTYLPQVRVAWTHDLRNDALTSQAALLESPFVINAASPGRDAALASLNLAAWQTDTVRILAGYTGEFRRNAISQQATGGVRVAW